MQVSEIMVADPLTVADSAELDAARRLLDEHAIRHLPVVHGGALVGVVSDRDLLKPRAGAKLVADVMRSKPVRVQPEESVAGAARVLSRLKIGCLPITRLDALVGLVTETDLLDTLVGSSRYGRFEEIEGSLVGDQMTTEPIVAKPETSLATAAHLVRAGGFRHLPITAADGRFVGLISDRDLRRCESRHLPPSTPIVDLVDRHPVTVSATESVAHAARKMAHERIGAVPVLDDHRHLLGILTMTDVLAFCAEALD